MLLWLIIFSALSQCCKSQLDTTNMPESICGWPSLHEGGRFPPANTRLAQRLLSIALGEEIVPDGVFTSATTDQIKEFQALVGDAVDGYLNIDTWPDLIMVATPLELGATGVAVEALQDTLIWNGFEVVINGVYDDQTANATKQFQLSRGSTLVSGETVDAPTWHLLTTQCNSTGSPGLFWFDAGWPQGNLTGPCVVC